MDRAFSHYNGTFKIKGAMLVGSALPTDLISDPEASASLLMAESCPSMLRLTLSFLRGAAEAA